MVGDNIEGLSMYNDDERNILLTRMIALNTGLEYPGKSAWLSCQHLWMTMA